MNNSKWLLVALLVLGYFAQVVFIPIFLALFLAMLLEPMVRHLVRFRISRSVASTIVVVLFAGCAVVAGWLAYTASMETVASLPTYIHKVNRIMAKMVSLSAQFSPAVKTGPDVPVVQLANQYPEWTNHVFTSLAPLYEVLSIVLFVPMLMFYFLVDKENLVENFNILSGRYFNLPKLNSELPRMLRVFFAANVATGICLIVVQGLALAAMGFENWLSLGLITGILNLLPIVGGGFAILAPLLFGVGVKITGGLIVTLVALLLALHFLANNLLMPLLVGSRLNINAVSLIIGLLFWSWMWGVAGFLMAVPMTALVKILFECNKETHVLANLMASKPRPVLEGRSRILTRSAVTPVTP